MFGAPQGNFGKGAPDSHSYCHTLQHIAMMCCVYDDHCPYDVGYLQ